MLVCRASEEVCCLCGLSTWNYLCCPSDPSIWNRPRCLWCDLSIWNPLCCIRCDLSIWNPLWCLCDLSIWNPLCCMRCDLSIWNPLCCLCDPSVWNILYCLCDLLTESRFHRHLCVWSPLCCCGVVCCGLVRVCRAWSAPPVNPAGLREQHLWRSL